MLEARADRGMAAGFPAGDVIRIVAAVQETAEELSLRPVTNCTGADAEADADKGAAVG